MKLLVFGSLNIDHVYQLPHLVREGETLASTRYDRNAGGKGLNQAIALAKAGQAVCFGGAIGADGGFLKSLLEEHGVDTSAVRTLEVPTGHALIQVDAQGRNSIILFGGANQAITEEMIAQTLDQLDKGDMILLQNEISHCDVIIAEAARRGLRVALNPSPFTQALLSWPLGKVDTFLLNEVEGADMTGETDPDRILDCMLKRWPYCHIVLTLGADGAMYADSTQRIHQEAFRVQAVDTTAAGDTFTGYFLHAMLEGKDPAFALREASLAASIAVSRPGAAASVPLLNEVRG